MARSMDGTPRCRGVAGVAAVLVLAVGCGGGSTGNAGPGDTETTASASDEGTDSGGSDEGTGSDGGEPSSCDAAMPSSGTAPLRRLTREQFGNAIDQLLGVEADVTMLDGDEKLGTFASNIAAPVSLNSVQQYRIAAETLAEAALPGVLASLGCDPFAQIDCIESFITDFGRRAFRRPLQPDEIDRYRQLAQDASDPRDGVRRVIAAMLQSPYFLYVVEIDPQGDGEGIAALPGEQIATRMALFLWNSIPDDDLLDAAASGGLDGAQGVRAEAERMLQDGRARAAVSSFHRQWLAIDELTYTTKDPAIYPAFDDALRGAMLDETRRFVELSVLEGDARLSNLLTADYSYIAAPVAELYGVALPADHSPGTPVALDPAERAGLLTHASFLAVHAHPDQSGPVQRGVVVMGNMFCAPPPPPPPDVDAQPPDPDPDATTRELFAEHTQDPACAGCHAGIDGIGLGFEAYDGIGRHRTTENGLPIDQSGVLIGTDVDGPFDGAVELGARMATSEQVHACVSRQWFRFATGRLEQDADACTVDTLAARFIAAEGDVRELMLEIVASDAFRHRDLSGGQGS